MGYTTKTLEEMNCLDDFLMNAVAEDPEVGEAFCRRLISALLQRELGRIRVRAQHALQGETPERKGIRLDIEVEELAGEGARVERVYNVEPHLRNDMDFPRHNRFYQARIDARHLRRGDQDYSALPDLYVITILNFDPFGYDRILYTIRNGCEEEAGLEYPDGLQFIYFYTEGKKGGGEELATLLRYFRQSTEENAVDDVTRELHSYVSRVKAKPEVRDKFMDFEEYIWYLKKDFRKEMEEEVRKEMTEKIERETAERVERETAERMARENTVENILELLEEYGEIPDLLQQELAKTEDIGLLKRYHKLAAKADSIREFMSRKETLDRSLA